MVRLIIQRFPESKVRFVDTVCRPTKQRQHAAVELAQHCHVVVVIGGANSNNTHQLVHTCRRHCQRVHHVQTAADLRSDWFHESDVVGITAGTSTPDVLIDAVAGSLRRLETTRVTPETGDAGRTATNHTQLQHEHG
jgi:4-hydroxy-3-methylbut-2-enyl diphosphate reductase